MPSLAITFQRLLGGASPGLENRLAARTILVSNRVGQPMMIDGS
jgi:hypothetical protein